jgi:hypothetical protein
VAKGEGATVKEPVAPELVGETPSSPRQWFDRFMVDLPGGAKLLVEPDADKLEAWGKIGPKAFRGAVTEKILSAARDTKGLLLVDLQKLTVATEEGEFLLGDYASLSEVECSEAK